MSKPDLGSKRVCVSCATRFYDLARVPAVCPKCAAPQPAERPRLARPGRMTSRPAPLPIAAEAPNAEADAAEDEDAVAEDDAEADDVEEIGVPSVDITS